MEWETQPEILDSLIRIYPFCKRLLLHTPWQISEFTGTQRLILLTSAVCGQLTMTHLAETIDCSKEQTTRAVAPLVQTGHMARIYDRENRTRVLIELTPQGHQLIRQQYKTCTQEFHRLLSGLSLEQRRQLIQSLICIYHILGHVQPEPSAGKGPH